MGCGSVVDMQTPTAGLFAKRGNWKTQKTDWKRKLLMMNSWEVMWQSCNHSVGCTTSVMQGMFGANLSLPVVELSMRIVAKFQAMGAVAVLAPCVSLCHAAVWPLSVLQFRQLFSDHE